MKEIEIGKEKIESVKISTEEISLEMSLLKKEEA